MPPCHGSILTVAAVVGFGPGLYVDFARFTFQVPSHGSADCAAAGNERTEKATAVRATMNRIRLFMDVSSRKCCALLACDCVALAKNTQPGFRIDVGSKRDPTSGHRAQTKILVPRQYSNGPTIGRCRIVPAEKAVWVAERSTASMACPFQN